VTAELEQFMPTATRISQATTVEQSRGVAEVLARVQLARQFPRSESDAIARMRMACSHRALALRAFYRYNKGGSAVTGETIQLAKELARCWGNIAYSVDEMRRDDGYDQSEMHAWAWDLEVNEHVSTKFIVPHKRDVDGGSKPLASMRDIYENNANNGARRLREQIFSVLPVWFIEMAKEACTETLKGKGDVPRPQRIADAIKFFEALNVRADQMEQKLGRERDKWTDLDLGQLELIHASINRGEITVDEEFPPTRVTANEITAQASKAENGAAAPQHFDHEPGRWHSGCPTCQDERAASLRNLHTDHDPGTLDSDCPGCRAESAAADREAAVR